MINLLPIDLHDPEDFSPVLLWHYKWKDLDFNPSGIVDGYYDPEGGWVGAFWSQDCCR